MPEVVPTKWKFLVYRASVQQENYIITQPCPEAVLEDFTYFDVWRVTDAKEIPQNPKYYPYNPLGTKPWTDVGGNHATITDGIQRELSTQGWFVTFDSLDTLKQFIDTNTPVRIWKTARCNPAFAELEIIDVIEQGI